MVHLVYVNELNNIIELTVSIIFCLIFYLLFWGKVWPRLNIKIKGPLSSSSYIQSNKRCPKLQHINIQSAFDDKDFFYMQLNETSFHIWSIVPLFLSAVPLPHH